MSTLLQHDQSGESPEGSPDAGGQPSRYFYRFCHRASTDRMPDWMGVTHGAEIQVGTTPVFQEIPGAETTYLTIPQ